MLDGIRKRRVQLAIFVGAILALSMTAEKFRELIGKDASSKSGEFTIFNCFDMGSGTLACAVKVGVKQYVYNIRNSHVERVRQRAMEVALSEAIQEGLTSTDAAKQAQKAGAKAAKLASRQAKRILGPIVSSGWDFFEAVYYGGTLTEGFLRGCGTLFGTYVGGYHVEQSLGKLGYFTGSHLGSWVGGRIGLMVYDVISGFHYLLQSFHLEVNNSVADAGSEYAYRSDGNPEYEESYANGDGDSHKSEDMNYERLNENPAYYKNTNEDSKSSDRWSLF